jgi:hypothetical protein
MELVVSAIASTAIASTAKLLISVIAEHIGAPRVCAPRNQSLMTSLSLPTMSDDDLGTICESYNSPLAWPHPNEWMKSTAASKTNVTETEEQKRRKEMIREEAKVRYTFSSTLSSAVCT